MGHPASVADAGMTVSRGVAALILFLVLIQPNHPGAMTWGALLVFPLELPAILLGMVALGPGRVGRIVRGILTGLLTVIVVLKCADFVSFTALARGFNPVADLALVDAFVRLLVGSLGPWLAGLAVIGAVFATLLVAAVLWWALAQWATFPRSASVARRVAVPAAVATVVAGADVVQTMGGLSLPFKIPGTAFSARVGAERVNTVQRTIAQLRAFRTAAQEDSLAEVATLLDRIDRDVLIIFVESYGRASLDTDFHASVHRQTLERYGTRLAGLGLSLRSGLLAAPTRGGQSWLTHATFANGLWVDNQVSYGAVLSSGRETLFHLAARHGFRTAAVMPQITLDWPEADRMGFETVLAAKNLGYAGLPFNWVTMPDQFTLAALDRLVRDRPDGRPLLAQVALASSHAPWVPVPEVIPWEEIGDGTVFNDVAQSGDPPDVVWRDRDRVRAQYRLAIDYSLSAVFEYAALHAEDPPLMIVIGDHQAAAFVALDDRPDVPFHVIGPEHLVKMLSDIAPDPGLLPRNKVFLNQMDIMRDSLLTAYSTELD